jgi:Uma2 family endonuclease
MATIPARHLTVEEYLDIDRSSERPSEFHDGEMFPIEAAAINHGRIQGNVYAAMRQRFANTDCEAFLSSLRVEIPSFKRYTYPDLMVACGKLELGDKHRDTLLNPIVLFEILSPSTAGYDRGEKLFLYQSIASLREYILISQDQVLIERYRRQNDRQWLYEAISSIDAELTLDSAGCAVPLREIYANTEIAPSAAQSFR